MATVVETTQGLVFIDPGSALAPRRYGLPPHQVEIEELNRRLSVIYKYMEEASIVVITHYHRDHYLYRDGEERLYKDKIVLAKDPSQNVNYNQKVRGYILYKKKNVENLVRQLIFADSREIAFEGLKMYFSDPLPHGECNTRLGWVLAVHIDDGDQRLLFASDTQGFLCRDSARFASRFNWDYLILSGPPTYLQGTEGFEELFKNLLSTLRGLEEDKYVILDHHLLRDRNYMFYLERIKSRTKAKIMTAAEYMNQPIRQLEAYRDELYGVKKRD